MSAEKQACVDNGCGCSLMVWWKFCPSCGSAIAQEGDEEWISPPAKTQDCEDEIRPLSSYPKEFHMFQRRMAR